MKIHSRKFALSTLAIWLFCAQTASAADIFKEGSDFYSKHQYQRAARCFIIVIRQHKNYWPAYYQLANTYLALNEYELARKYYDRCVELLPDFKTVKSCKLALDHIESLYPREESNEAKSKSNVAKSNSDSTESGESAESDESKKSTEPPKNPALAAAQKRSDALKEEAKIKYEADFKIADKRRTDLIKEAMKRAETIRAEARARLQEIHDEGTYRVRDRDTGEISLGVPEQIQKDITNEAEERAKRVIDDAEIRARGIQMPREPDWESFKVQLPKFARKSPNNHK